MRAIAVAVALILGFLTDQCQAEIYESRNDPQDIAVIAYHIDLRVQVMPLPALRALATEIADLGFNAIIMEWEATFPYAEHPIIPNRYAYSREEVRGFLTHCENLGLDVIPLQQTMGHLEYVLMHERYAYLRADKRDFSQVDPTRIDAARELFSELIGDIIATHDSKYIHIGGDETRLLDCGRCQVILDKHGEEQGKSRLYVDYMRMIAEIALEHGKIPLLWADMILAHPDAIADMPEGVIYIDWNYGWKFDRFGKDPAEMIAEHGLRFWGATAIRSAPDDYHVTTWNKHMSNQRDYVQYARGAGFDGMVLTSWATSGQYGYEWFGSEVVQLYPIRNTYPHAYPHDGYRMNTSAFIASLQQREPLDPGRFAQDYAVERFGINEQESDKLWNVLKSDTLNEKITVGSIAMSGKSGLSAGLQPVKAALAAVRDLQATMRDIVPTRNEREFAHLVMQVDLREFYLSFREIEGWVNSAAFEHEKKAEAARQLQQLLNRAADLDQRFSALFSGALYESEIAQLNEYRSRKIRLLQQRLSGER